MNARRSDGAAPADLVLGIGLDAQSRCVHYYGPSDIIAIKFKCCGKYYACKECHASLADHAIGAWPVEEWDEAAIRCGVCKGLLTIRAYLDGPSICPECGAAFNPRCRHHHHFYFAISTRSPIGTSEADIDAALRQGAAKGKLKKLFNAGRHEDILFQRDAGTPLCVPGDGRRILEPSDR